MYEMWECVGAMNPGSKRRNWCGTNIRTEYAERILRSDRQFEEAMAQDE